MYKRTRLTPEQRESQILDAAIKIALKKGLYNFSIANVSSAILNSSKQTVKHYFGNITKLRTAVIKAAIERGKGHESIVAQAITMRDDAAKHLTKQQRRGYLNNV